MRSTFGISAKWLIRRGALAEGAQVGLSQPLSRTPRRVTTALVFATGEEAVKVRDGFGCAGNPMVMVGAMEEICQMV